MKRLLQSLEQFWFSPMPAERLAILRLGSGGFSLWYLLSRYALISSTVQSDSSNFEPVGLAFWLTEPLPYAVFMGIYWATIALNIAYLLGWKFRFSGPFFAIASLFVFSYRYSWSMIYHDNIAVVLQVWVIAFAPAAAALSMDAYRKKETATPHWHYGWPIRLLCAATLATYFLSGLAKVYGDLAWAWVDGSAMRSQVAVDALRKDVFGGEMNPFFEYLYPNTSLFLLMGLGTMVLELGAPLAILNRRLGMIWAGFTWLLHIGIYFVMGITFRYQMSGLIFLPFFDVEKLMPWLRQKFKRTSHTVDQPAATNQQSGIALFDGTCSFCNGTVRFIANRDPKGRILFAAQQSDIGRAILSEHSATADLSTIFYIENGTIHQKSTAILRILHRLRQPWPTLAALALVCPRILRDGVYDWVARNRYHWFGQQEQCPIPPKHIRARFLG
jgi:predicted DCC family thiol-disulfide oxidoreductase YuxK